MYNSIDSIFLFILHYKTKLICLNSFYSIVQTELYKQINPELYNDFYFYARFLTKIRKYS